jgi:NAD(P)-dependent dehydrogenase (short-subunit alcohol dehydrogenase family)
MPSSKDLPPITTPFFPRLFIRNQFRAESQRPPKDTNLSGKVAIITGGNTGLGFESARQLFSFNLSRLILAVRSPQKGEAAAKKLNVDYPKATIEVWQLDMGSYDSMQAFVQRAESQLSRLDVVILNAGRWKLNYGAVPSTGHEELIQINYLSTVLLCILLLPVLRSKSPAGTPGRLTIINAALSLNAKFPNRKKSPLLPSFDDPKSFDGGEWYNTSKLLAHMFLYKLVDYVSADDVVVNLVDPGFVEGTELARDVPGVLVLAGKVFAALTARSIQDGASTYLDACLLKGKESHGCFIMGWQIKP